MTFGQGAHRVRLFRRFATRNAGRHPLTTGADDALLKWNVSRASGGYSEHARVGRISYTLSRDTTGMDGTPRFLMLSPPTWSPARWAAIKEAGQRHRWSRCTRRWISV